MRIWRALSSGTSPLLKRRRRFLAKAAVISKLRSPRAKYTSFISHIETYHKDAMMDVYNSFKQIRVADDFRGPMDDFNPKRFASAFA